MKLTKKLEAEILKAYNDVWDAYLRGDMRIFASILDENCYIIGSAAGEVFKNKKAAVKYYKATAEQITGKAEFRNRKIKVMPVEKGFMVNEESDFYLLIDDQWTFYGPARISSLFHKKNNKWKVIHQHGSFPDSKTEKGEQINTEKIKAENIQLRDAVKRRTVELEQKNRELEIESSLEKVRAQAMGMYKPDDLLNVCKVLFEELGLLGFSEIRNAIIHTFNDEENYFIDYDYADLTGGVITNIPYSDHPVIKRFLKQIRRSDEAFAEITVKGKELNEWKKFRKSGGQPDDPRLDKTSALYYYFHSVGTGDIGISTFSSINEEKLQLLKRFRNVFDLAYKRYTDITKAEAQAREAEIELALERVRAKTMAMQKPSEFVELITVIGEQFVQLGFDIEWVNFGANGLTISEGIDIWNFAVIPGDDPMSARVLIPYFDHPVFTISVEGLEEYRKTGNDFFVTTLGKDDKDSWLDHFFTKTVFKDVPDEYKAIQYAKPGYTSSNLALKDTWLSIGKFDARPFTDEQHAILRRFGKAFGQAYTRFLDLQKAEAQAKEAQIEAGLERVRSRAMAMQSSEQLRELIGTVFTELTKLDIVLTRCLIMIYDPKSNDSVWWMANSEAPTQPIGLKVQYHEHPSYLAYVNAWKQKELKWTYTLEGNTKKEWDDFLFVETELSHLPDFVIAGMKAPDRVYLNASFNSFGNLTLATLEPLSDEHFDIMLRFAKVFDLTYTRFNDLKQAEAQAREARIETALERVRARTMAMQKSDELPETTFLLFQQLKDLGETAAQLSIGIIKEEEGYVELSATVHGNQLLQTYHVPANEPYVMGKAVKAWKEKQRSLTVEINGKELKEYNSWRNSVLEKKIVFPEDQWIVNIVFFSKGMLSFSSDRQIPKETLQLLERFAGVFDHTYTRFLDLQKAEAQTREAQIELALERVRARTMAMHKSEELAETAQVLFQQLLELGGMPDRISIGIADEVNDVVNFWSTDQLGSHIDKSFSARLNERTVIAKAYKAWKEKQGSIVIDLQGDDLKEWIQFAREEMGIIVKDDQIKNRRVHTIVFFSHGWILVSTHEPQSFETVQILERFASVFNLTYRRFLDLQKAEAQAREAQIEAALERVRSSSLAMHKSDELKDVVKIVFENFRSLGLQHIDSVNINIFHEGSKDFDLWLAAPGQDYTTNFHLPYFDHPIVNDFFNAVNKGESLHKGIYGYDEKNKYFEYMFENSDNKYLPEERKKLILNGPGYSTVTAIAKYSSIFIHNYSGQEFPEEVNSILQRFTRVFEQSYTRFLDLQKAEAQAREAQIETALEKVRSRSLAMHKSDELQDVVNTVFERLEDLNIEMDSANIAIFKEGTRDYDYWIASHFQKRAASFHMPYVDLSLTKDLTAARESGADFSSTAYSFEDKNEWFDYAFKNTDFKFLSAERKQFIMNAPAIMVAIAFSKHTGVQVNRYSSKSLSEGEAEILKRFSKVFEQAYIRFLDLEKAEAQAREAQIETSLERVRSKTMAMHNSQDVADTVVAMFDELVKLGVQTLRCGVGILHDNYQMELWTARPGETGKVELFVGHLDMKLHPLLTGAYDSWKDKQDSYSYELKGEDLINYFNVINNYAGYAAKYDIDSLPSQMFHNEFNFNDGVLFSFSLKQLSTESSQIFKRFAGVFGQTYRRYLDLEKAEAQARESQIEASLERVRSKTMAMHNSKDVGDTVATMFAEFMNLDIHTNRCGILIFDDNNSAEVWTAKSNPEGKANLIIGKLNLAVHNLLTSAYESWKAKESFHRYDLLGDDIVPYYEAINRSEFYPVKFDINALPSKEIHSDFFFPEGAVFSFTAEPLSEEHSKILRRFAGVFGQTYRRYLDLQKAEAQAREAQIEAGLERVRAKAMAMHSSKDLAETLSVFYRELKSLSVTPRRCGVAIMNKDTRLAELTTMNTTEQGDSIEIVGTIQMSGHPVLDSVFENWLIQKEYHAVLKGNQIKEYYQVLKPQISYPDYSHDVVQYGYYFMFKEGDVYAWTENELSEEDLKIFRRFTTVISLTYKRYKDLQQAEVQAREAQIEAGLERVRARTMAMHSSEDVGAATATMFTELERLGIDNLRGGITNIHPDRTQEVWSVNNLAEGKVVKAVGTFNMDDHPFWQHMFEEWINKKDFVYTFLTGKEKEDYIKILNKTQGYLPQSIQQFPDVHFQVYSFNEGGVWTNSLQPHSEEDKQVMKRFASVFSLTYRRYQDLRKAEAQAEEATIEAALEKVRGKAMAMHNSNDLSVTASMIITELRKLGISPIRCGVGILNKETHKAQLYTATSSADGDSLSVVGWVMLEGHPVLEKIYETWVAGEDYFPELSGDSRKAYYEQLLAGLSVPLPDFEASQKHYGHFFAVSVGCLYTWSEVRYNDDEIKTLKRFASIIDLTFRRYFELQKSEVNAREAVKQAALDRVRAEIASMRTVSDLERITPLIWNELTILGIPFIRCGVFIMDEDQELIHTFLSTPDGKAIAAFHLPYDTPGNLRKVVSNWKQKKNYIDHWDEDAFIQFADILVKQGALDSAEMYLKAIPKGGFHLHFLPFLQGMLYVGNTTQLGQEEIELIQHVADAFSTAYARYEDFNKLEAAKQQVENTLTDLKQAQTQLVQAEKMASLGELTAGIAHEIQNPLNFVNNFSEVSKELLDEMKAELASGNTEDAKEIADDVIQNLEKINHHGKRADAIVKSMLQHSRSSSGKKEPTDINSLADEYLRLAYHGLRAKDKTFNAKFETDLDNSIGKINIISQDIGRVLVNLINNAFYAVSERKKQETNGYEPTVEVLTKKIDDKIEIKVKDNGNGIPKKVLDKIFQPFFTTKPTGQGTGLGLSLAYDIITKGHGGELKVETKEGEGSEFIIQLPNHSSK
jgi:signal transduction histidine kinase